MADEDEQRARSAADRLADLCVDVVGAGLRSVVLHGSLAAGGFRPGRSDIDLLAVVDGRLSDSRAAAIEQGVRTADAGPADRVDLHVVTSGSPVTPRGRRRSSSRSAGTATRSRSPAASPMPTCSPSCRWHARPGGRSGVPSPPT